jgi:hypothetical protein
MEHGFRGAPGETPDYLGSRSSSSPEIAAKDSTDAA